MAAPFKHSDHSESRVHVNNAISFDLAYTFNDIKDLSPEQQLIYLDSLIGHHETYISAIQRMKLHVQRNMLPTERELESWMSGKQGDKIRAIKAFRHRTDVKLFMAKNIFEKVTGITMSNKSKPA